MAPQSKKNSHSSSGKKSPVKKSPVKKAPSKKRPKKKIKSQWPKHLLTAFGLLFIISLISFAYYLGQKETEKVSAQAKVVKHISKIRKKKSNKKKSNKKETKVIVSKKEVKKPGVKVRKKVQKVHPVTYVPFKNTKPKLVIIIDDVHTQAQINAIKALHMKITPSIFPPYKLSPNSNRLAQRLEHYMIHLPMESGNRQFNTQYKTLKVSFSNKKIENRIKELRLLFPKAKFINNHTGSVFTSNYASMHLAYKIMRENGFIFLDSKTTNRSKVKEIAHSYGDVYVSRDIFLDNTQTVTAVHKQLKKAVMIAKKKGYAVAIGHPHTVTIKALGSAKNTLKEVELLYIDELYQ